MHKKSEVNGNMVRIYTEEAPTLADIAEQAPQTSQPKPEPQPEPESMLVSTQRKFPFNASPWDVGLDYDPFIGIEDIDDLGTLKKRAEDVAFYAYQIQDKELPEGFLWQVTEEKHRLRRWLNQALKDAE